MRGELSERGDLAAAVPGAGGGVSGEARADDAVMAAVALSDVRCADSVVSEYSGGELCDAAWAVREVRGVDTHPVSTGGAGDGAGVVRVVSGVFCSGVARAGVPVAASSGRGNSFP